MSKTLRPTSSLSSTLLTAPLFVCRQGFTGQTGTHTMFPNAIPFPHQGSAALVARTFFCSPRVNQGPATSIFTPVSNSITSSCQIPAVSVLSSVAPNTLDLPFSSPSIVSRTCSTLQERAFTQSPTSHAPVPAPGCSIANKDTSELSDFARVLVRCQNSQALAEENKFDGYPLHYHLFMKQVEDRILSIHGQSDSVYALQLLLESTTGRVRKLIYSCMMLPAAEALNSALRLLFEAFGSPSVALQAHLKLVCEGQPIRTDERNLQYLFRPSELLDGIRSGRNWGFTKCSIHV